MSTSRLPGLPPGACTFSLTTQPVGPQNSLEKGCISLFSLHMYTAQNTSQGTSEVWTTQPGINERSRTRTSDFNPWCRKHVVQADPDPGRVERASESLFFSCELSPTPFPAIWTVSWVQEARLGTTHDFQRINPPHLFLFLAI